MADTRQCIIDACLLMIDALTKSTQCAVLSADGRHFLRQGGTSMLLAPVSTDDRTDTVLTLLKNAIASIERDAGFTLVDVASCLTEFVAAMRGGFAFRFSDADVGEYMATLSFLARKDLYGTASPIAMLDELIGDDRLCEMMHVALTLAGGNGKINLKKEESTQPSSIELIDGFTFELENACQHSAIGSWNRTDVACFVLDGFIEGVHEIDSLLQSAHAAKAPMIIFARNFGDEVVKTIEANRIRKTLDVMLMRVAYDEQSVNVLNDLAIVAGCDLFSVLKGSVISSQRFENLPRLQRVMLDGNSVTIQNTSSSAAIALHVSELEKRSAQSGSEAASSLLDRRIKSLQSQNVSITLRGDGGDLLHDFEQLDAAIRFMRAVMQDGIVSHDELLDALSEKKIDPRIPKMLSHCRYGMHHTRKFVAMGRELFPVMALLSQTSSIIA